MWGAEAVEEFFYSESIASEVNGSRLIASEWRYLTTAVKY
jgi:hypothetical protein